MQFIIKLWVNEITVGEPPRGNDGRVGESRHKRRYQHGGPDVLPVSGRLADRDYERIRPCRERLLGVRGVGDSGEKLPPRRT